MNVALAKHFDADGVAQCAERIRRSILTLHVQPDGDVRRLAAMDIGWPEIARERAHDFPDEVPKVRRFVPKAKDVSLYLDVLKWLQWLRENGGARDEKIIWARAFGAPWWRLAQQFGKSERTVQRWYDGAITQIWYAHWSDHYRC